MDQLAAVNGVLVLDKPRGISSASAVDKVRRKLKAARAGHGGTLDPLATGVLPVCLGHATRLLRFVLAEDKAYEAEGLLGVETDTLDRTGDIVARAEVHASREAMEAAIATWIGEVDQVPPAFSALKVDGDRAYDRARRGEVVELASRRVRIDSIALTLWEPPRFAIAVACGKGTYIRSLIADLGRALGCGAHLTELRRTRAGKFGLDRAVGLDNLDLGKLIPIEQIADLPSHPLPVELLDKVRHGVQLPLTAFGEPPATTFQLIGPAGELVAVCHGQNGIVRYDLVVPR